MTLLEQIYSPADIRNFSLAELKQLAGELRHFIINEVAAKEGHLGAGLGVVELTIALHYVFNTPEDILVFDVGHQAYPHKLLTGRRERFATNRQWGGLSGFPKRKESEYDPFGTGHAGTSLSAVLGMATAAVLQENFLRKHVAVIGDASFVNGMAFEALNQMGNSKVNMLIVLNDNQIGIDPSTGAFRYYLERLAKGTDKGSFFADLQIEYLGSYDGHSFEELIPVLSEARDFFGVQLVHIRTTKGKGYQKAEERQTLFHAPGKFDPATGILLPKELQQTKFQDVFGQTLCELAAENKAIVGITPAMVTGSSLHYMQQQFPSRTFDVGIAEEHAVTFAAGLATQGLLPFLVIYSTFLQRGYDQLIHDVALQELKVIFCIDRAGLVGEDGATHQGVFDIAYLRCIPNIEIVAPRNEIELRNMLYTAQLPDQEKALAIRYPRGYGQLTMWQLPFEKIEKKGVLLREGSRYAVLSVGTIADEVAQEIDLHPEAAAFAHYDMRWIKPLDEALLHHILSQYEAVITVEEGCKAGGFGESIVVFAKEKGYSLPIKIVAIADVFVEQGTVALQREFASLTNLLNVAF
ncbi:1-deoxy-D-xylulose-5-phosphate synthase [Capnocytophaga gingivalis]|jgi:1-deoxy-D-xylulose-5-phosphate synthase